MSLSSSFSSQKSNFGTEDYFDLDNILCSSEKLPCRFEVALFNLGKFLSDNTVKDFKAERRILTTNP